MMSFIVDKLQLQFSKISIGFHSTLTLFLFDNFPFHNKNSNLQNVPLKKGLVNFRKVFWILKKIKYKKNFTFETTRSNNPYKTAKKNIIFIKKLLNV